METPKLGMKQTLQYIKRRGDKPTFKNKTCKSMLKKDWDFQRTNKEDHGP